MENIILIDISFHNNNNSNSIFIYSRYRKIPKKSPRAYIFQRPFFKELIFGVAYIQRGLCRKGNLHLKSIGLALFLVGILPFFFVLFCIWGQFSKYKPRGAYIWRGDLTEGFLRYRFGGLIFGGAYTWRGLFSEFNGISPFVIGSNPK